MNDGDSQVQQVGEGPAYRAVAAVVLYVLCLPLFLVQQSTAADDCHAVAEAKVGGLIGALAMVAIIGMAGLGMLLAASVVVWPRRNGRRLGAYVAVAALGAALAGGSITLADYDARIYGPTAPGCEPS